MASTDPTGYISIPPDLIRGVSWKQPCRLATTGNITISTALNNGDSIDGVTLATGDRVLVKDQSTGSQNGIYVVGATPARAFDMDQDLTTTVPAEEVMGAFVYVIAGSTNGGKLFRSTNTSAPTLGTTALTFTEVTSGGGSLTGFYNVADYGAVGDGTTDDTTAITDTFDAADATGGGIIYFPPTASYYKITSLITRTGAYKYHLLGGGSRYGPARVHQATANTGAFKFAPSTGTANRDKAVVIENLVVSGAGGASSGKGIEAANDIHMERCFVYGFYDGLYIGTESYYSYVSHSTFTDCDHTAITLDSTNNTTIDTCRITGLFSGGSAPIGTLATGIFIACPSPTGLNTRIINTSIEYFTDNGILLEGGYAVEIVGNYFESQQSSSGFAHIKIGTVRASYATRIESNYFQGDGTSGFNALALDRVTGAVIADNKFGINSAIGISSTANTSNILLWNNDNSPSGTFSLPSSSYTLDPASPPATVGTPALTFGTANSAGSASTAVRTDATLAIFDATVPVTQAFGDTAATGSAGVAARRDHKHGMPAAPSTGGQLLIADTHSTPIVFADVLTNEAGDDFLYGD